MDQLKYQKKLGNIKTKYNINLYYTSHIFFPYLSLCFVLDKISHEISHLVIEYYKISHIKNIYNLVTNKDL